MKEEVSAPAVEAKAASVGTGHTAHSTAVGTGQNAMQLAAAALESVASWEESTDARQWQAATDLALADLRDAFGAMLSPPDIGHRVDPAHAIACQEAAWSAFDREDSFWSTDHETTFPAACIGLCVRQ